MPVFKDCEIYFGGYDLSAVGNEVTIDSSANAVKFTNMASNGNDEFKAGIKNHNISVMTFLDQSVSGPALTQEGTTDILTLCPWPSGTNGLPVVGDAVYAGRTLLLSEKTPMKVGDAAQINATGSVATSEGLLRGSIMAIPATVSSTGTGTIYNYGAQTAPAVCYFGVHVTAVTGTATITPVLQSAALVGFGSPTDRVTLSAISAIGTGFGSSSTATTNAFWRVSYTIGGTGTITFSAFMAIQ